MRPGKHSSPILTPLHRSLSGRTWRAAGLARKSGAPDIMLGVVMIDTGPARMAGTDDSGEDPVRFTVSLNPPIWRNRYRAEYREAVARRHAIAAERTDLAAALAADAHRALYRFHDAARPIHFYRDPPLPKAKQTSVVLQAAFRTGRATLLDLLDAQQALLEFGLGLKRARTGHIRQAAQIERILGKDAVWNAFNTE